MKIQTLNLTRNYGNRIKSNSISPNYFEEILTLLKHISYVKLDILESINLACSECLHIITPFNSPARHTQYTAIVLKF